MTFTTSTSGKISVDNSSATPLAAGATFNGVGEDVSKFGSVAVTIESDVDSAATGVDVGFSTDNTNFDEHKHYTFTAENKTSHYQRIPIRAKYFRISYTNGGTIQTVFRLQVRFHISDNTEQKVKLPADLIDGFNRVRTSRPYTTLSQNFVMHKQAYQVAEKITGSTTSTHNADASTVVMASTGVGSVMRRSRTRGIYQPGKSQLIYLTGVLNNGTNASTVTTRVGYYDNDGGFYFQHVNGVVSVVKRTSVTGSLVETVIASDDWNINALDGTESFTLDPTKTLIFWMVMEWLGVGSVTMGVIIDEQLIPVHSFRHSNMEVLPYVHTASLPPTYELISTGGAGSMQQICYTAISEGGFNARGLTFAADMGNSSKTINATEEPLMTLRHKTGASTSRINSLVKSVSVVSTSGANGVIRVYKFIDTAAATILTGSSFVSANSESSMEYDISATAGTFTTGILLASKYFSNNNDQISIAIGRNGISGSNIDLVSDLIVVTGQSLGANESFIAAVEWDEFI
jgi:hypothetical protein